MMKIYNFNNYKIIAPETMFVAITDDNLTMVVVDKEEKEVHCIIEYVDEKLILNNGWNINYTIDGNEINLMYNFRKGE